MNFWGRERGLTLIETLVAVLIFSIAMLAVSSAFKLLSSVPSQSKERVTAVYLAKEQLELLKRFDESGNDRTAFAAKIGNDKEIKPSYSREINNITYKVTTSLITNQTSSATVNFKSSDIVPVRVIVYWDFMGRANSLSLETCIVQGY